MAKDAALAAHWPPQRLSRSSELTVYPLSDGALETMRQMVLGVSDTTYRFDETKGTAAKPKPA